MTAQKQSPSALDFVGAIKEAVALERRVAPASVSKALKDVVARCTAEYNRMVSKKAHRIDTPMRNLIMNLSFDLLYIFGFTLHCDVKAPFCPIKPCHICSTSLHRLRADQASDG